MAQEIALCVMYFIEVTFSVMTHSPVLDLMFLTPIPALIDWFPVSSPNQVRGVEDKMGSQIMSANRS